MNTTFTVAGSESEILSEVETYLQHNDWDGTNLAAFINGTLAKRQHPSPRPRSKHRLTFSFPYRWDPSAKCPRWLEFIQQTFDADTAKVFRAAFGWTIKPKEPDAPFPFEKSFDIEGPKGSGGVILKCSPLWRDAWCCDPAAQDDRLPSTQCRGQGKKAAIDFDSS